MSVRLFVREPDERGEEMVMLLDAESALGPPTWFNRELAIQELTQIISELRFGVEK